MLRRLIAFLGLLVLPGAAHALPSGAGASDPSIVVGVVATLTGPGALAGQDLVDGFNLALKQLGGRFSNQEVRVVLADDKGSPDIARQQVKRLMDRERLDMVLTGVSAPSLATIIKPLVDARLFVLNLDQSPPALSGAECSQFLFSLAAPVDGLHEAMGQYLAAEHIRRVVVVGPQTGVTNDAVAALKRTFPGEVVAVLSPHPGAATFAPELDHIKQLKPDAIYSLLTGGMGGGFVRAWGASPLKGEIPLFPLWPAVERQMLPAMADAAQDMISIGTWGNDLDSIPNRRLNADFEMEFGRPPSTWAAQGYDAAFLVDSALKATNGKTSNEDALRTALRRADFISARGSFKFNTNQFPVLNYYLRKVSRDAKGRPTHEMRGVVLKEWRDRQAHSCPMRWVEEPLPVPVKK
ncbi:MAG: ABC transporter substrate-binding protein [Rhodospirillaceae bacterium]|nr:ABC transporter substrate-binding protein [Rhodospirillales bacterium]